MKIQLAKSPCYPPYGVVVTINGEELWDCDCAAGSIEDVRAAVAELYPGEELIEFDDPRHYSQTRKEKS